MDVTVALRYRFEEWLQGFLDPRLHQETRKIVTYVRASTKGANGFYLP